ncbi:MAG TPA: hypothetical protein VGO97_00465, partial [Solirubrobacterales bacterium]|nr:hypothetical protein [Solirubrobacterales bacterium]
EAAETHQRLELQSNELRAEQAADQLLRASRDLDTAVKQAGEARAAREGIDGQLAEVAKLRQQAEQRIAAEAARREKLAESLYSVRSAAQRLENSRERAAERVARLTTEIDRHTAELGQLELDVQPDIDRSRIAVLESELAETERQGRTELEAELVDMRTQLEAARKQLVELEGIVAAKRAEAEQAEQAAAASRRALNESQQTLSGARRERARLDGELAAVDQFLREAASDAGADALAEQVAVEAGYELAVAAVLGRRLRAAVVNDFRSGQDFLDRVGEDGGSVLLAGRARDRSASGAPSGAERLLDKLSGDGPAQGIISALLGDVWVVDALDSLGSDFDGVAVTRSGRVLFGATGELRQAPGGGEQKVLSERNRRVEIAAQLETASTAQTTAQTALETAEANVRQTEQLRDAAHDASRAARLARDELSGTVQGQERNIERRIEAGLADGPTAVRRAAIEAELRSERSHAESLERAIELQRRRRVELQQKLDGMRAAQPHAYKLAEVLGQAAATANEKIAVLSAALDGDRETGEQVALELRQHATREAELQAALREKGELVTTAEVQAQRSRDIHSEASSTVQELSTALGRPVEAATELLDELRVEELSTSLARIARRRELLGPINPLAQDEYAEAIAHVEELESQREDLESALKELGDLIKEIDRTIRTSFEQTFESTSAHFEELIQRLFPGGSGKLNLVEDERPQTAPLTTAGADASEVQAAADAAEDAMPEDPDADSHAEIDYGVEIEVTLPGSKSGRRLSLLSGGERSLVALAFLFSVFLTRPCPFYVFDEAEAALDDINIDRLVALLREHSAHSQFIVITHQKRTMDAADCLYGVSMGADGVSKVVTRRLQQEPSQSELAVA